MCQMSSPLLSLRDEAAMLCPHAYGDIADRIARVAGVCSGVCGPDRVEMGGREWRHALLRHARRRRDQGRDQCGQSRFAAATGCAEFVRCAAGQHRSELSQLRDLETSQRSELHQHGRSGHGQCPCRSCLAARSSAGADGGRSTSQRIPSQCFAVRAQGRTTRHAYSSRQDSGWPRHATAANGADHFLRPTRVCCSSSSRSDTTAAAEATFLTVARCINNAGRSPRFKHRLEAAELLLADWQASRSYCSPDRSRLGRRCRVQS
jgi:hypothetical protein